LAHTVADKCNDGDGPLVYEIGFQAAASFLPVSCHELEIVRKRAAAYAVLELLRQIDKGTTSYLDKHVIRTKGETRGRIRFTYDDTTISVPNDLLPKTDD